jgi:hypothetical protein
MKTCNWSGQQLLLPLTSCAAASPAKTSLPPASELASQVLAAACGLSTSASFESYARGGSWSRMSPVERVRGLTPCSQAWESKAMLAYRSRLAQRIAALRTYVNGSSLLPTLTKTTYGTNQGGAAGRAGPVRESLQRMAAHRLLPTLCRRDEKGIGPQHTQGGQDLPRTVGGHLSPTFCEWFMGFPEGWTSAMPARGSRRSATQSSRSAPK